MIKNNEMGRFSLGRKLRMNIIITWLTIFVIMAFYIAIVFAGFLLILASCAVSNFFLLIVRFFQVIGRFLQSQKGEPLVTYYGFRG